jgi:hypothetical protein
MGGSEDCSVRMRVSGPTSAAYDSRWRGPLEIVRNAVILRS